MKNVYVILFIILSFISCKDEGEGPVIIEADIDIYVTDKDGNDLLDPNSNSEKRINLKKLQLVYLIDDEEIVFYKGNLDAPRGFSLVPPEGKYTKYILSIFPNTNYSNSITYLKWDELDVDTLSVEYIKKRTLTVCSGVELNGKQVWGINHTNEDENRRLITIIK